MKPIRGIPTTRAYWDLKAEQVLNRVFEPEKPIEVEVCDTPPSTASAAATQGQQLDSIPVELHDLASSPARLSDRVPVRHPSKPARRVGRPSTIGLGAIQHWVEQLSRQPNLLLAGASITVMVVAGMALVVLGVWNQSQQAIRQERNMLLIERLRTMGPGTTPTGGEAVQASAPKEGSTDGELPPPPPGEPWMEELATLPASSAPAADVLKVPVNSRITSPAPAATGSGGGSAPQLVGVVQVPGQSGSAIFQIGDSSTSASVGESIGSSGWRLRSASGDSAVIEKGGEQRRVSISSGF